MLRTRTTRRLRTATVSTNFYLGALAVLGAAVSPAMAQQCPAGQNPTAGYSPTGVVRNVTVPGSASGLHSGILMQPGFLYRMTAVGSIRVGVFGETGTPPDGWVPQGACGRGCPSETAYTFSLLYRVGSGGAWELLGAGQATAKLGPRDPAGSELQFGINDTKLSDNDGAHVVTITELRLGPTTCRASTPAPAWPMVGMRVTSPSNSTPPNSGGSAANLPCAGKTPDGRRQAFQFALYCGGLFSRNIPVEACTRAEALPEAQAFARSAPSNCVLAP
jgi:hypothetical protein